MADHSPSMSTALEHFLQVVAALYASTFAWVLTAIVVFAIVTVILKEKS